MKLLFATKNPAKVKKFYERLKENNIELLTVKDINIDIKIDENGKDAIENAYLKAKAYYDATKLITIGMDNNLFIEGLPDEKQPGTYVRRINGKELTDDEMLEYYLNLVKEYGGRLTAKWVYGIVIYDGKKRKEYTWSTKPFYFIDKASNKRNKGYPLDSMSIDIKSNKYFVDLTDEDKKNRDKNNSTERVIEFIINNI